MTDALAYFAPINGVKRLRLQRAFERVEPKRNWRDPIDAVVLVKGLPEIALIGCAVMFYTATKATCKILEAPAPGVYAVRVRADGYRLGPAGDN